MSHRRSTLLALATLALLLFSLAPSVASAFCGFYVSGANDNLYNNATMVVLMRDGQRTVLSMQNNYQGPAEDFALVVPVPVVLKEDNVKTLDPTIFDKVDKMASPRLVEYWEQDPCEVPKPEDGAGMAAPAGAKVRSSADRKKEDDGVKIEARFTVGEYNVLILSASDSSGLDRWLTKNAYNVPKGAKDAYQPYIDAGMYFFVAKVDLKKVKYDPQTQQALLSPLRFHYDDKGFSLPIRLGLINAKDAQDLIVHILARNQRYEVSNYKNVTIPTNIDVTENTRQQFGEFYAALFDKTLERHPGAVVTEYAWDASTCDPCPGPNLTWQDFMTLGADVLPNPYGGGFVLTRLHTRYTAAQASQDLVFEQASPIVGGREFYGDKGKLERGAVSAPYNNFQGRYAIRHVWQGELKCQTPVRGRWGGPPAGTQQTGVMPAQNTAFAKRGSFKLTDALRRNVPELGLRAPITTTALLNDVGKATASAEVQTIPMGASADNVPEPTENPLNCALSTRATAASPGTLLLLAGLLGALWLRR